jgi:hypothetical protein
MYHYRVFISYAHDDQKLVEQLDMVLKNMDLIPVWDKDISGGTAFDYEIRRRIARAHVLMPLITSNSRESPWIHQEIGYALGIGVPVIPVALGTLPEAMLSGIQAICVKNDLSDLRSGLEQVNIESLVLPSDPEGELERLGITTHVAEFSEDRTRLMVSYAWEAWDTANKIHELVPVRQRAIFSSFSLPNEQPWHAVWDQIDLPIKRSEYFRMKLLEEREILEKHAQSGGCSLILNPFIDFSPVGAKVHRIQLRLLREFLMSMPRNKIKVGFGKGRFFGNLTIIGDWFGSKALPPRPGSEYRQTVFSHHAPTVLSWVREFDEELENSLRADGVAADDSRDNAIKRIDARLKELPED